MRDNAAIILECSNITPFKWSRSVFVCFYCTFSSADFGPMKEHVNGHTNRVEAVRLAKESTIKADVTGLKCELCFQETKDLTTLIDHLIDIHKKSIEKKHSSGIMPYLLSGDVYRCAICDEPFQKFFNLTKHLNEHYANSICPLCGKAFSQEARLKSHLFHTHEKGKKRSPCKRCGEIFESSREKQKHMESKHGILRHKCPYCNEAFKTYGGRMHHMLQYHDKKDEYPCNMCSATFLLRSERTKHIKNVHIRDKKFACTECSFRFVSAAFLRNHMVKHGGERKFQCQVCKKAYARKKTLREHMRIHDNDRRFACSYCSSAFVQKCSLKSHMKTHHPNAKPLLPGK